MLNVIQYFKDYFVKKRQNKEYKKKNFARAKLVDAHTFSFQQNRKFHI